MSAVEKSTLNVKLILRGKGYEIITEGEISSLYQEIDALAELQLKIKESLPEEEVLQIDETPSPEEVDATPTADIPSIRPSTSNADNVRTLFGTPWGNTPRNLAEIAKAFEVNGIYLPMSTLAPALLRAVRRGDIRRIQKDGKWAYYQIPR